MASSKGKSICDIGWLAGNPWWWWWWWLLLFQTFPLGNGNQCFFGSRSDLNFKGRLVTSHWGSTGLRSLFSSSLQDVLIRPECCEFWFVGTIYIPDQSNQLLLCSCQLNSSKSILQYFPRSQVLCLNHRYLPSVAQQNTVIYFSSVCTSFEIYLAIYIVQMFTGVHLNPWFTTVYI